MMVDASLLQNVSTLHVVVTMLSVWQEHTATVRDAYSAIAVDRCTLVYFLGFSVCSCRCCVANVHAVIVTHD